MSESYPMRKYVMPETVFGDGAAGLAGRYAKSLGATSVLLVSDPGLVAAGWAGAVEETCLAEGLAVARFLEVSPNPRCTEVGRGVEAFKDGRCDAVVVVGGGSPMDAAKGIAASVANDADVRSFEGVDMIRLPGPPLVCVASTAGTGSEVSRFSIINDVYRKVKIAIISPKMVPDAALVDPRLISTVPLELIAATGMDALTHAFEAYVSSASSALTDLDARRAAALVARNLERLYRDPADAEARGAMALASMLAGRAFSNAGLGVVHAMAHALGGLLDAPHGLCNALLLDAGIEANFESARERYADLALDMGASPEDVAAEGAEACVLRLVRGLRAAVGIAPGLGGMGASRSDIRRLAGFAARDACLATNPARFDAARIEGVFERAF
ncbi:MAG: iron-containing alcohol dehydrogenase [Spirochaetes bacterium]|nr:iron-containing alcohol dehydrogenase [Spirochaetota bacterium]